MPERKVYRFHLSFVTPSVDPMVIIVTTFSCLATSATASAPAELTTPNRKSTPSFWMYRLERFTDSWTFALSSAESSSSFFPSTPPFALISSTASSAPSLHSRPSASARPDRGYIPPSLIVSAATAVVASISSAATPKTVFRIALLLFPALVASVSPLSRPRAGRDDDRLAVDHQDLVLVEALGLHPQALRGDHLHDLHARRDLVPDEHGGLERKGLREVEAPRPGELHADGRGDGARRKEPVGDALPEPRLRGELPVHVHRVPVPRDPGEQEDVFLGEDLRALSD